jgi:hypothetical protein
MRMTITISNEVAQHLNSLSLGEITDVNDKLRSLLESEYRRRLAHYSLTDRQFTQKYNMDFETFERQQLTKQHGYNWEIESDAIAWETAVDGIRTIRRQLAELINNNQIHDN